MFFWLAATKGTHLSKAAAAAAGAVAQAVARAATTPKTWPRSTPKITETGDGCIARRLSSDDPNCVFLLRVRLYFLWLDRCPAGSLFYFHQFLRAGGVTSFNVPSYYMLLANHSAVIQPHPTKGAGIYCCLQAGGILAATQVCCAGCTPLCAGRCARRLLFL